MPIRKTGNKYYWGSKGPFDSRKKAEEVAQAAHASGYKGSIEKVHELHQEAKKPTEWHRTVPQVSEIDASIEKIIPAALGAVAGAVGRVAVGAAKGGGGMDMPSIIPDEIPDPTDNPHAEEEWNRAVQKDGDGGGDGGAFNSLSDTVFTSSHAGIFTPSFGERGTKRRHRKNKRHQDYKRKKLMGEDKKNGLERLVQFLREGSPRLSKRQPDKMMTGQFQSIHVDRQTPRKQIDWRKRQKGISKVEAHPSMAADTSSLATSATYPGDSEGTWTGTKPVPAKMDWGTRKTAVQLALDKAEIPKVFTETNPYHNVPEESHEIFPDPKETHKLEQESNIQNDIEKAGTGGLHGIGPLTNQNTRNANGIHPQDAFLMVDSDDDKKQQVVDQNDFEKRVRGYDTNEDEKGNIDQPMTAGATKGMMDYPNSNMQMMEKSGWGSGIDIHQDDLLRGGELDEEDVDIEDDKEDDSQDWIPEDENKVKAEKEWLDKFQLLHKSFVRGGDATPVLSAILALDNE